MNEIQFRLFFLFDEFLHVYFLKYGHLIIIVRLRSVCVGFVN